MSRAARLLRAAAVAALLALGACRSTSGDGRYSLVFEGNRSISERVLRSKVADNLVDFERFGYPKSSIDDAAFSVESHYRSQGFPFALASYSVSERRDGFLEATITVEEGPRTRLGAISFVGNTQFSHDKLAPLVGGPTSLLGERTFFVQSEIDSARLAIADRYLAAGNLQVKVDPPQLAFREDDHVADVTYVIHEGPTFLLDEVRIEGAEVVGEEELRAALPVTVGAPYVPELDRKIRAALVEHLGERGYPDARVSVSRTLNPEESRAVLRVKVEAGSHVVVSAVRIEGNEKTRAALIESRLDVEVGKAFTPTRERRTFRRLFSTGLFSRIRLDLEGEGEERELVVAVVESPSREIFVEPGWGSYELARLKAGYRNLNLFGTGRGFRTEAIAAVRHQELEVGVSDPFLFGADVFADASAEILRREEPSFTRISAGIDFTVSRAWTPAFVTGISYDFQRSKARDVDVTDPMALAALQDVDISAIEVSARYDTRDSPLVPSRGHSARAALQWGDMVLGSELDFLRARYSQSHFFGWGEETVIGVSLRTGAIVPTHDTVEIPLQERFFNGGESTVRSFRQDELGPLDMGGVPLGGEAFTTLNLELRRRLVGNLSAAAFGDLGNVVVDYTDYFEFDDFRSAIGVGLRYFLPIGPLRLDAAWNPHPEGDEEGFLIHFSVGMPF